MATYNEIYDLWVSQSLKKQIVIAVLKAATDVMAESDVTENHANRLIWAKASISDPYLTALEMSAGVIMNPTVQAGDPIDADIQFVINGLIDVYAVG